MSTNPRQRRHLKKNFAAFVLILGILGISVFFLNLFFASRRALFISPMGKAGMDVFLIKKILKDNGILFSEVTLSDYSYLVNIQNNGQVRLSQDKDIKKQVSSLQRILRELTIEGKPFKSLDFRFAEPVIVF